MSTTEAEGLNALKDRLTDSARGTADYATALDEQGRALLFQLNRLRDEARQIRSQTAVAALCDDIERWLSLLRAGRVGSKDENQAFMHINSARRDIIDAPFLDIWPPLSPTTSDES